MNFKCPICQKDIITTEIGGKKEITAFFPFCSQRCKLVDLGAWLDGDYVVPSENNENKTEENLD